MKTLTKEKIQWMILIFQVLFLGLIFAAIGQPEKSESDTKDVDVFETSAANITVQK